MGNKIKKSVNLQGVICPLNFVKTKIALEDLEPGDLLEVFLDEGSAMTNVPRSVKDEGHRIVKVELLEEAFRIVIEKGKE